jgi:hypothetical protein
LEFLFASTSSSYMFDVTCTFILFKILLIEGKYVKFLLNINDAIENYVDGNRQEQNGHYESYVEERRFGFSGT